MRKFLKRHETEITTALWIVGYSVLLGFYIKAVRERYYSENWEFSAELSDKLREAMSKTGSKVYFRMVNGDLHIKVLLPKKAK